MPVLVRDPETLVVIPHRRQLTHVYDALDDDAVLKVSRQGEGRGEVEGERGGRGLWEKGRGGRDGSWLDEISGGLFGD